jgi:hypothetical protein
VLWLTLACRSRSRNSSTLRSRNRTRNISRSSGRFRKEQ